MNYTSYVLRWESLTSYNFLLLLFLPGNMDMVHTLICNLLHLLAKLRTYDNAIG